MWWWWGRGQPEVQPANGDSLQKGGGGRRARGEVTYVEVGKRVLRVTVHVAVLAVHKLVDHPGDELRREGDDKRLRGEQGGIRNTRVLNGVLNKLLKL